MQIGFRFAAFVVVAMVAGCAGGTTASRHSAVVSVSAYGPDMSGQREHGVGARLQVRESGGATSLEFPLMELRDCNEAQTACALGIGEIDGTAEIISTGATSATVAINLKYQVGRQQVPADVQALQAHQVISKHIEVAYGEVVHLPLQYGVNVAVCAQKHAAGEIMPDRSICKGY